MLTAESGNKRNQADLSVLNVNGDDGNTEPLPLRPGHGAIDFGSCCEDFYPSAVGDMARDGCVRSSTTVSFDQT